jgi:hypothetical protein
LSLKALSFAVSLAFSFNALSKEPLAGLERIGFSSFRRRRHEHEGVLGKSSVQPQTFSETIEPKNILCL